MPLRLRRGTDTERQLITPQEGELIYVTDTKELWAGDGITPGGIKVSGNIPETLNDLSDVDLSVSPQIGQTLKWNGAAFVPANDIDTYGEGVDGGSNYRINIVADDSTIMVDTVSQRFTGNLLGDVIGSVFSDDSTILVDAVNGTIPGSVINGLIETDISANLLKQGDQSIIVDHLSGFIYTDKIISSNILSVENGVGLRIVDTSDYSGLRITRNDPSVDISDPNVVVAYGAIYFERNDINGLETGVYVQGGSDGFKVFNLSSGFDLNNSMHLDMNGNLGVGKTPTEKLDINGNAVISGTVDAASFKGSLVGDDSTTIIDSVNGTITSPGFIQFGSYTDTERNNNITPANGMIIYNTTANRFQGYQNGVWINLDDGSPA